MAHTQSNKEVILCWRRGLGPDFSCLNDVCNFADTTPVGWEDSQPLLVIVEMVKSYLKQHNSAKIQTKQKPSKQLLQLSQQPTDLPAISKDLMPKANQTPSQYMQ
eukprot:2096168-Ditylum_brightwellii.AAC.1